MASNMVAKVKHPNFRVSIWVSMHYTNFGCVTMYKLCLNLNVIALMIIYKISVLLISLFKDSEVI